MKFTPILALAATLVLSACGNGLYRGGDLPPTDTAEYFRQVVGDRVFFATNRHDLNGASRTTLNSQAEWLQDNPTTRATIEGHADERGTREYNLALGERRANAVMTYLVRQGVASNRLRTVSYGKERPVALGSTEASWSQNRRGMTVVSGAPDS